MRTPREITEDGFPSHVFPKPIADFIEGFAKGSGSKPSYVGCGVIACASGICDDSSIEIKPDYFDRPNFYLCVVGRAGSTKSAPIKKALKPLMKREAIKNDRFKDEMKKWEREHLALPRNQKADHEAQRPKRKPSKVITDGSIEAMFEHMEAMDEAGKAPHCVFVKDELKGFFGSMNKFKSGGDDYEMWLSLFSGTDISKTLTSKTVFVRDARSTVIGSIQPEVFRRHMQDKGDGMIDRFLIAFSDESPQPTRIRDACDGGIIKAYFDHMDSVFLNREGEKPPQYSFWKGKDSLDMLDCADDFHIWAHKMGEFYKTGSFKKWEQCFYRICVILARVHHEDELNLDIVEKAKSLSEYFAVNWLQTKIMAEETEESINRQKVKDQIGRSSQATSREIQQALKMKSNVVNAILLDLLSDEEVIKHEIGKKVVYSLTEGGEDD